MTIELMPLRKVSVEVRQTQNVNTNPNTDPGTGTKTEHHKEHFEFLLKKSDVGRIVNHLKVNGNIKKTFGLKVILRFSNISTQFTLGGGGGGAELGSVKAPTNFTLGSITSRSPRKGPCRPAAYER